MPQFIYTHSFYKPIVPNTKATHLVELRKLLPNVLQPQNYYTYTFQLNSRFPLTPRSFFLSFQSKIQISGTVWVYWSKFLQSNVFMNNSSYFIKDFSHFKCLLKIVLDFCICTKY
ncbi:hypothetical protein NL108_014280 [Boleophthalmus pectinirostris]|nr:hypothetical protein NL108_014280 [Boleophthalmus pectinirostris]